MFPVVFGRPRSGTSALMRAMLYGGIDIEYRDTQNPEQRIKYHNPHGFYEVRAMPSFTKCFKCLSPQQISKCPITCKIIYIERDCDDIVASWKGINPKVSMDRIKLNRWMFEDALLGRQYIRIKYKDLLTDPLKEMQRIKTFLEPQFPFNADIASTAIDKTLYNSDIQ